MLHKAHSFIKLQLMSALGNLERFGEEDYFFINWRLCRHCLQSKFFQKILTLCMVSIQEQFVIKRGLWWCWYSKCKSCNKSAARLPPGLFDTPFVWPLNRKSGFWSDFAIHSLCFKSNTVKRRLVSHFENFLVVA